MLNTRESIDIAELVIYIPTLLAALLVTFRQGFSKQLGFLYLLIFCAVRIAGAAVGILSQNHPTDTSDAEWAAILSSVGLSPLILAGTGLLKRVNDLADPVSVQVRVLQGIHIPCILGLILAIVGGTKLASEPAEAMNLLKAAGVIFVVAWLLLAAVAGLTFAVLGSLPRGEKRVFFAVVMALPLLAVRLLYTLLVDFKNDGTFNILHGNAYVQLGMAIIEEMIVAIMFVVVGMLVQPVAKLVSGRGGMQMAKPGHGGNQVV